MAKEKFSENWLVKSAGRVMGPFSNPEVVSGLQLRHFTSMDEIALPFGRWTLIRDVSDFSDTIRAIRNAEDTAEHTMTSTLTMTATTPPILQPFDSVEARGLGQIRPNDSPRLGGPPPLEAKPINDGEAVLKEHDSRSSLLFYAMALLILVSASIFGTAYFKKNGSKARVPDSETYSKSLDLKAIGKNKEALELLLRQRSTRFDDSASIRSEVLIGELQIADGQSVTGRQVLQNIIKQSGFQQGSSENLDMKAEVYTSLGLSYMLENDWNNANTNLQKALEVRSNYPQAALNKALVLLRSKQFDKSESEFVNLNSSSTTLNVGYQVLGAAMSSLGALHKGNALRNLPVVTRDIEDYFQTSVQFRQELLLIQAFIGSSADNKNERIDKINKILMNAHDLGEDFTSDILVDSTAFKWGELKSDYCLEVVGYASKETLSRTLLAYCMLRAGQDIDAKKIINEVIQEIPNDPVSNLVRAVILKHFNQDGEARSSLKTALSNSKFEGALVLKARFFEQDRDLEKAEKAWRDILTRNPKSLEAMAALAKIELSRGNKGESQRWVALGLSVSNNYRPLLEVKSAL